MWRIRFGPGGFGYVVTDPMGQRVILPTSIADGGMWTVTRYLVSLGATEETIERPPVG